MKKARVGPPTLESLRGRLREAGVVTTGTRELLEWRVARLDSEVKAIAWSRKTPDALRVTPTFPEVPTDGGARALSWRSGGPRECTLMVVPKDVLRAIIIPLLGKRSLVAFMRVCRQFQDMARTQLLRKGHLLFPLLPVGTVTPLALSAIRYLKDRRQAMTFADYVAFCHRLALSEKDIRAYVTRFSTVACVWGSSIIKAAITAHGSVESALAMGRRARVRHQGVMTENAWIDTHAAARLAAVNDAICTAAPLLRVRSGNNRYVELNKRGCTFRSILFEGGEEDDHFWKYPNECLRDYMNMRTDNFAKRIPQTYGKWDASLVSWAKNEVASLADDVYRPVAVGNVVRTVLSWINHQDKTDGAAYAMFGDDTMTRARSLDACHQVMRFMGERDQHCAFYWTGRESSASAAVS